MDPLCVCGHPKSDHAEGICDGCLEAWTEALWLDAVHEFDRDTAAEDAEERRKELH